VSFAQASLQAQGGYDFGAVMREVHGADPEQGAPGGRPIDSFGEVKRRFAVADDAQNKTEVWERREGSLNAAIATMEGRPCPKDACAKCCGHPNLRSNPTKLVR